MGTFEFDKTRLTAIKVYLDTIIGRCNDLAGHYKSAQSAEEQELSGVFVEESKGLTEWRDSCERVLNGTARTEVNKESLCNWLSSLQGLLDSTTGLVLMFGMDPNLPETMQQKFEELAGEFEKLDALVRSERELYS